MTDHSAPHLNAFVLLGILAVGLGSHVLLAQENGGKEFLAPGRRTTAMELTKTPSFSPTIPTPMSSASEMIST